jgi:hypothetical protein
LEIDGAAAGRVPDHRSLPGALAGFLIWRWRDRESFRAHPARVLELAASLSLALAFTINLAAGELPYRGIWLLLAGLAFVILLTVQVPVPKAMQGRSLTVAGDPRTIYGETFPCPVMQPPECPRGCAAKAVFDCPMKFVSSSSGKRELFDLSSDPGEQRNLYIQQHERATQMDAALGAWKKVLPSQTRQHKQVDPEKLKQLKGLGYIQ